MWEMEEMGDHSRVCGGRKRTTTEKNPLFTGVSSSAAAGSSAPRGPAGGHSGQQRIHDPPEQIPQLGAQEPDQPRPLPHLVHLRVSQLPTINL